MQNLPNNIDDCWNKIGVWRSDEVKCPELENVIHCRNCSVYTNSGLSLLNQDFPENYRNENTEIYKQQTDANTDEQVSLIIFRIQKDWYALRTSIFLEIDANKSTHKIPHNKNNFLEGLVNIRGELELCISLPELISNGLQSTDGNDTTKRLIIIKLASGKYALKLDEISGVYKIGKQAITPPPATIAGTDNHLVCGIFEHNNQRIGMIDDELLDNRFGVLRS